jgi:hypothetical protein
LYNETQWLGETGQVRVAAVVRELEFQDIIPVKQVRPITAVMIERMVSNMDLEQLYVAMAMALCHDSLMRSGELLGGLSRCVTVHLYRTKAHRRGGPEKVRIGDFEGQSSAYKLLLLWFDMWDLWSMPKGQVLPKVDNSSRARGLELDFGAPATARWWKVAIGAELVRIGCDPTFYSGHSFRAGGATDLFVAGVPYSTIKKMGRWRSDAALKYHRDELNVAADVATAFGRSLLVGRRSHRVRH